METVEKTIEVNAPLAAVYNQWTQFEEFPQFMEHVEDVRQLNPKRLYWRAKIAGHEKEWEAEIFEQVPDHRIAWRSVTGAKNSGMVNFVALDAGRTQVSLKLHYVPEGALEKAGDFFGVFSQSVEKSLERFKEFMEAHGTETGAWRGEIRGRQVKTVDTTEPRSKRIRDV